MLSTVKLISVEKEKKFNAGNTDYNVVWSLDNNVVWSLDNNVEESGEKVEDILEENEETE